MNPKQAHTAYDELIDLVTTAMEAWLGMIPSNPERAQVAKDNADFAFKFSDKISDAETFPRISTLQTQFAQDWMHVFTAQTQKIYESTQELLKKEEPAALQIGAGTGFKDIQDCAVAMAKKNAESAFALVEKTGKADNIQHISSLQAQFVQKQMQAYVAQAQELKRLIGDACQKP